MKKLTDIIRSKWLLLKYKYKSYLFMRGKDNTIQVLVSKIIEESKDDRIRIWKKLVEQSWEIEALETKVKTLENKIKVKAKIKKK